MRHRAFHDLLTELANRALFFDRVEHALTRQDRDERLVSVLLLDLDDFELINDRLGHAAGDELLVGVARRLRACLRSADTAARLGGDEFGVLLESVAGPNEPVQAAERILAAFDEPVTIPGQAVSVAVSLGIALGEPDERGVDELLRKADLAMYAAKDNGKRCWELYQRPLETAVAASSIGAAGAEESDRLTWFLRGAEQREEIATLLERDDALQVVYQPILDLRTGLIAAYEALARFVDPLKRPPNVWFAQAHRCGLGHALEAKAVQAALAAPSRPPGTRLSLNASPSALASPELQAVLPERLDGLVIEITENELVTNDPSIGAAIAAVRARGARLAVDDAGAGYAGLKHVMRLAPDLIKLDRGLTEGVHADPVKAALIESFVRYAREIDATVCAEGIETLADLERLADLDVAYGQGYAIGRPAAPWAAVAPDATTTCIASFATLLEGSRGAAAGAVQDRRLAVLGGLLANATTYTQLTSAIEPIAHELCADHAVVWELDRAGEWLRKLGAHGPCWDEQPRRVADYLVTDAVIGELRLAPALRRDPGADPAQAPHLRRLDSLAPSSSRWSARA